MNLLIYTFRGLYLMVRMKNKREWMKKYTGKVCPKLLKKLEK